MSGEPIDDDRRMALCQAVNGLNIRDGIILLMTGVSEILRGLPPDEQREAWMGIIAGAHEQIGTRQQ